MPKGTPHYGAGAWFRIDDDSEVVRCHDANDMTDLHDSRACDDGQYDSRCNLCWLGYPHTDQEHDFEVKRSGR